ncbi:MAG: integrase [Cupriavidus sp.]|jgi:site-specific recombinase XerD|uniref:phage integrase family protein n=2 Tax=Cupriavidus TaxID=106589 RepID=UPI0004B82F6D|nr:phage integrase family protein [Cupriavidus pauculus]MBU67009.1 integrase [Cupriavidus sp.]MCM3608806.1 site-specific integrase [Cupriavidus pauculus]
MTMGANTRLVRNGRRRAVTRRPLHRGHFGFLRAIIQGLHARPMWERYLADEGEIEADAELLAVRTDGDNDGADAGARAFAAHPKVRRVTAWLRSELEAAALRASRPSIARRIKLDPKDFRKIGAPGAALPSLEEFAAEAGLDGFSEAEQLAAYQEKYGDTLKRESRRARLMKRQLDAIDWLEERYVQPVAPGDACRAWLTAPITDRLEAAGIVTLGDLLDRINGLGSGWTRSVRAIGAGKARMIESFLQAHADTLGQSIGGHVEVPRRQRYQHELAGVTARSTSLVPLEKLSVPAALDGREGLYRLPQARCLISAHNDYEAVLSWLRAKNGLPPEKVLRLREQRRDVGSVPGPYDWLHYLSHTQRAYRKEAERFLLWAILERRKPLSSMNTDDCIAYREFLGAPPSHWCAPRSRERWSPLWRPFEGPLEPRAQAFAITVLKNLYRYLNEKSYLAGNPWSGIQAPRSSKPSLDTGRSFTVAQWAFVCERLDQLPDNSVSQRLQVALPLLYATGLRLSELVSATTDDLEWLSLPGADGDEPQEGWWLSVVGKRHKRRRVPVPDDVMARLARYLEARGLGKDAVTQPSIALLGHAADQATQAPWAKRDLAGPEAPVAATTLYRQVKRFFQACAAELRTTNARDADRLAAASTHWMRHTHISHALAAGVPLQVAQQNAGHDSLDTTTVYVTTEDALRSEAMRKFFSRSRA